MSDLEIREFEIEFREESDEGTFEGIAVPWGQTVNIGGRFSERFERGSITPGERVSVYRDHKTLIGHVIESEDREEGFWVRARVGLSDLGRDTLALLRSGALNKLSVGFLPIEDRRDGDVTVRSRVSLREVSVVERPAYSLANVLTVREESPEVREDTQTKELPVDTTTASAADLAEVRSAVDEIDRKLALQITTRDEAPVADTRSAAAFVKALASGDEATAAAYNRTQEDLFEERAYTGATTADAPVKAQWVGDLTNIFDASSGVLANIFATGTLPAAGNNIEYAKLASNSVKFDQQVAEGDDLAYGKVTLTTETAPVKTYGGYVQLTRQTIERSTLPVLNRSLEALALAAGARKKAELRTAFNAVVAQRTALAANAGVVVLGATLAASTPAMWTAAIVNAAIRYDLENVGIEALVVSATVFLKLDSLTITGEKVFRVADGSSSGTLNLPGLTGNLAGIPVVVDPQATGDSAVFVNGRAIRQYDSSLVSLQDENIVNLSKTFSVYRYGAIAPEVPQYIVPVKLTA